MDIYTSRIVLSTRSPDMEIVSTMGSGSLGRELDLDILITEVEKHLDSSVDANFIRNGMATVRLDENGPTYTVFRTGSFQIRGAKTEGRLNEAANEFREVLSEIGVEVPDYEFNHITSVFMSEIDRDVDLAALTISLGSENTEYEPEQFPGLIYRPPEYEATLLVFANGKVLVVGTTDRKEASSAIHDLEENPVV